MLSTLVERSDENKILQVSPLELSRAPNRLSSADKKKVSEILLARMLRNRKNISFLNILWAPTCIRESPVDLNSLWAGSASEQ